jgi:hypothetical protein
LGGYFGHHMPVARVLGFMFFSLWVRVSVHVDFRRFDFSGYETWPDQVLSVALRRSKRASVEDPGTSHQQRNRDPNPEQFALENDKTASREKAFKANRGHVNGSPGQKVAAIIEWRKKRDSKTAVRHGVQYSMARGG